jgi:hypothetical protein
MVGREGHNSHVYYCIQPIEQRQSGASQLYPQDKRMLHAVSRLLASKAVA